MYKRQLPDRVMQLIAQEHNLAETAFCVPNGRIWQLRWFTPEQEIDLCGHATLATAYVLFEQYGISGNAITFHTQSGELVVLRQGKFYSMSLPVRRGMSCEVFLNCFWIRVANFTLFSIFLSCTNSKII